MTPVDLLLPETDAGALGQVAVAAVISVVALIATRRRAELRVLVLGVSAVTFGLFGLRMLH